MKQTLLLFIAAITLNSTYSQISDSVQLDAGYASQVFYKLSDGSKTKAISSEWDLQFFASLYSASIRLNSGFGAQLYLPTITDTTNFTSTTLDTAGRTLLRDGNDNWENDAFTSIGTGHPNYGWGVYQGTGALVGNKVFAIKLTGGAFKKIWIKSLDPSGAVTFTIADLDGSNLITKSINRNTYNTKRHFYYDVENDSVYDSEPQKSMWELVFRKYEEEVGGGMYYNVTGVLSNYDIGIAEVENVEVNTAKLNWATYSFDSTINIVGYDWKSFNNQTFMWEIEDSLSYFIKDNNEDIYQVVFTGTGGSADGKMYFTKELISSASVEENSPFASIGVYPNPVNDILTINYEAVETLNKLTFTLIDMNGRVVKSLGSQNGVEGFNQGKINLSDLNSGVYLLNISTDNYSVTKRIIKN